MMKRRTFGQALLGATAAAMVPGLAHADVLSDIKSRKKLVVGVKNDYPPFGYLDSSGKLVGYEVDLARYLAKEIVGSADAVELVPVVASNRIQFLQAGRIDLILATLGETAERAQVIDFTTPDFSAGGPMLIVRKDIPVSNWDQAKGRTFCSIQGSYYIRKLTEELGLKLINFTALPDAYKALADRRCDGIAFDEGVLKMRLMDDKAWAADYKIGAEPYEHLPQSGGVKKGETALLAAVNAGIKKAAGEGKLLEWIKTYGIPENDYVTKFSADSRKQLGL
jgi:polar amino acid transport system substrate-binding protein